MLLSPTLILAGLACESPSTPISPSGTSIEACPEEGWCWVRGRPLSVGVDQINRTVFAVGEEGAFLRWEGERWVEAFVPTRRALVSAWVKSASDLWASDDHGSAWQFDGAAWVERPGPEPILTLIGAPDGMLWAKSSGGSDGHGGALSGGLLRWTGDAWVSPMVPHPYCLGASDFLLFEDEIWTAGLVCDAINTVSGVEVRRWDGEAWALVGERIPDQSWYASLALVDGRPQVRASGRFEFDGVTWHPVDAPQYPQQLPSEQRALFDGFGFTIVPSQLECGRAARLDEEHAWCFGEGRIYVQRGAEWSPTLVDPFGETADASLWNVLPPRVWAGSDTELAWGSGPSDVYRVRWSTGRMLEHFDGEDWSIALDEEVFDLDGSRDGDVWVTTATGLYHLEDGAFQTEPLLRELARLDGGQLHALTGGTVLMIDGDGLFAFDGTWSLLHQARENWTFTDVAGSSLTDLWLVSHEGGRSNATALEHFDGAAWSSVEIAGLDRFGELTTTSDGETWLLTDGLVQHLGSSDAPLPIAWRVYGAGLWIGSDSVWISTSRQSVRHPLE